MKSVKPRVEGISTWDRTEILYKCPKCNTSFRMLTTYEKFCHNCGQKINWNVPRFLKEPYVEEDWRKTKQFIEALDKIVQEEY